MKNYRQYIFALFTAWLVFSQSHALEHAIEHEVEGHQEACSICLDATQFSSIDVTPAQEIYAPQLKIEAIVSFETVSYSGLFFTPYTSRAPPSFS